MKLKNNILFFTILFGVFTSCTIDDKNFIPIEVSTTLIGKGNLHGSGIENITQQNLVIKDANSWNQLIDQMNTVNNETASFTEIDIDFSEYQIIAVFDEIKSSGGHSIDITSIIEYETNIVVGIENLLTGDATLIITQPFYIVKIEQSDKPIVFD